MTHKLTINELQNLKISFLARSARAGGGGAKRAASAAKQGEAPKHAVTADAGGGHAPKNMD